MAKKNTITQEDVKKLFESTKKKLQELGKETGVWLKKGEVELSRISKIGRLELDIINLNMKREKLFKEIGKRVVEQNIGEKIEDTAIKSMSGKAITAVNDTNKKKREISRIKKTLLKGNKKKNKN
ncbi:MAG: hypothetical protein ISS26_00370 [Candidatus Omnitrophica bacterium]|nr:hypothetical protein [Candidatus Omnitrophota bacterium]